jgi:hypothetical protein
MGQVMKSEKLALYISAVNFEVTAKRNLKEYIEMMIKGSLAIYILKEFILHIILYGRF